MAAMKAAYVDHVGPVENIRFGDLPAPDVGPFDVLVRTTAVCVDPEDTLIRSGRLPEDLPLPFIVGRDVTGVVQAVGAAVSRYAPGDRVWSNNQGYHGRQGTFAEFVAIREDLLYPLPAGVDDRAAVAFVHSGLTASLGLQEAKLRAGEVLFINGGAGHVGSAVLQLARARGARVVVTAGSDEGLAWCRALGAERTIKYRTEDVDSALAEVAPGGADVYWDASGRPDFDRAVARVARRGRIVVMCGYAERPPFPVGPFYVKHCSMHGFAVASATDAELQTSADEINHWIGHGRMRVRIGRVMPLSAAAAAHRMIEEHAPLPGKVVLVP
jgi:NADPH2:quinone reductase